MKRVVTAGQVAHAPVILSVSTWSYSGVDDAYMALQGAAQQGTLIGNKITDDDYGKAYSRL